MNYEDRVKRLQTFLKVTADGKFGPNTLTAVEKALDIKDEVITPPVNSSNKAVCICIGHSTTDKGAVAYDKSATEYEYNKELADIVKKELEKNNIKVYVVNRLTDGGGTGMSADIKAVNKYKTDCIVELHCNAYDNNATGTETLYWKNSSNSKRLAELINTEMVSVLALKNRGIKPKVKGDRGAEVLEKSYYPMVITEPFFIDNPNDLMIGLFEKEKLGNAIANGIIKFL